MPTIYTKDIVAEAVEQNYWGEQGVYTGTVANSIGYANYTAAQQQPSAPTISSGGGRSSDSGAGFLGLCAFGGLAYGAYWVHQQTGSWWAVAGAGVALAVVIAGIVAFFRTQAGRFVLAAAGYGLLATAVGFVGYGVYSNWGLQGLLWMGVVIATPFALGLALRMLGHFFGETRLGRTIVKIAVWGSVAAVTVGLGWTVLQVA
ncbi:MAG: hypothetical protein AAF942_01790 [Pseudomonadota bacterium]